MATSDLAHSLPRRRFVAGLLGASAALALSACGGTAAVTTGASSTAAPAAASSAAATSSAASSVAATTSSAAATTNAAASISSAATSTGSATAASSAGLTTAGLSLTMPSAAKVTIRYSSWGTLTNQNVPIFNGFMQQHPDIAVNFDTVGTFSEYFAKVQLQVASGAGPDVIAHSPYYHVTFAAKKVTRVLDDLVARDKIDLNQLYPPLVASGRWHAGQLSTGSGSLYVIPASLNTGTIYFYNKTLFQQASVQPPDESWTWDTMLQAAQKMTRAAGANGLPQYGLGATRDGNGRINTWIWENGGDFFDKDFTQCTLRSDGKAYDAFTYLVDLVQKYKVAAAPSVIPSGQSYINLFEGGNVAMTPGGMWWSPYFATTKGLDFDVFLPPKNATTGSRVIDVYTNGQSIGTSSKYVDQAWTFITWWTMGDGLPLEMANIPGTIPAHIATANKYVFNTQRADPPKSLSLYADVLPQAHPIFVVAGEGDIANVVGTPQNAAFNGTQSVDAAATTIQQQVTAILGQQRAQLGL